MGLFTFEAKFDEPECAVDLANRQIDCQAFLFYSPKSIVVSDVYLWTMTFQILPLYTYDGKIFVMVYKFA